MNSISFLHKNEFYFDKYVLDKKVNDHKIHTKCEGLGFNSSTLKVIFFVTRLLTKIK
jgi:hypothetical protein